MRMPIKSTTVLCVRKDGKVVMIGDGQVTFANSVVIKQHANKIRLINAANSQILVGFAGSAADGLSLVERLEAKLELHSGQLMRACVELAKDWRLDKILRRLEAIIAVADKNVSLIVTGNGDVIEPDDGIISIGSGGQFALAAARALIKTNMDAPSIANRAMEIAADICVYTNNNFKMEIIESK